MNSFGLIKTKIETFFEKNYKKNIFKKGLKEFKHYVIDDKSISEAYYIYDELSSQKGLNESIVDDYISESFEQLRDLIDNNQTKINSLGEWIDGLLKENVDNRYPDIDYQIYTKNVVKNLESLLESKLKIKNNLLKTIVVKESTSINLPLSTMLKVATKTFNDEYVTLNESDKNELKYFISLDDKSLKEEISNTKDSVIEKLNNNLNESTDTELKEKLQKTINKINESENSLTSLYKLRKLESGLIS